MNPYTRRVRGGHRLEVSATRRHLRLVFDPRRTPPGVSRQEELSSYSRTGTNCGYLIQDPRTAVSRKVFVLSNADLWPGKLGLSSAFVKKFFDDVRSSRKSSVPRLFPERHEIQDRRYDCDDSLAATSSWWRSARAPVLCTEPFGTPRMASSPARRRGPHDRRQHLLPKTPKTLSTAGLTRSWLRPRSAAACSFASRCPSFTRWGVSGSSPLAPTSVHRAGAGSEPAKLRRLVACVMACKGVIDWPHEVDGKVVLALGDCVRDPDFVDVGELGEVWQESLK